MTTTPTEGMGADPNPPQPPRPSTPPPPQPPQPPPGDEDHNRGEDISTTPVKPETRIDGVASKPVALPAVEATGAANTTTTTTTGSEPGNAGVNQAFCKGEEARPVTDNGAIPQTESQPNTTPIAVPDSSNEAPSSKEQHALPTRHIETNDKGVEEQRKLTELIVGSDPGTGQVNKAFSPEGEKAPPSNGDIKRGHLSIQNADSQHFLPKEKENGETTINGKSIVPHKDGGDDDHDYDDEENPRVFFRRWFMLLAFCMYSFSNAYQWINLNIIGNVIVHYYNASLPDDSYQAYTVIDMLSMVYMIAYIPLIFPATWLLDRKGLRLCCIIGSLMNAIGAGLKCFSVAPDRFSLLMVAQTICGISQIWVLGIPPRLAAVWFGPNQVSTATSIGVFGNQVGIAVGFLIPPLLVKVGDIDKMTTEFLTMHYITAGVTIAVFIFIVVFLRNSPPHPPSKAQFLAVQLAENENYLNSLFNLFRNKQFLILMVAYGVNTGSFYAISTLLNTVILHYHAGEEEHAGQIGLTLVLLGVVGAIIGGIWLDRTKTFKSTTIAIYLLTLAGMVAFTFTLQLDHIWIVYVTAGSLGFFMTGYLPVGFEFAAEITYPESEGTSSGLLNMAAQIFGVAFTLGMRAMMENFSVLGANITLCCFLLGGTGLTAIIKPDYKRQEAGRKVLKEIVNIEETIEAKS